MSKIEKIILGALGGLSAVLVKFLGQDYNNIVTNAANFTDQEILSYEIGYGILTPILMFLGAFVGWLSEEKKPMKIVAMAIAAPAMITTWSGGTKESAQHLTAALSVPSAYAADMSIETGYERLESMIENTDIFETIEHGIDVFFGYNKAPKKYWVIVGSYKNIADARKFVQSINDEENNSNAFLGVKPKRSEYYPVIYGSRSLLKEAEALKTKALKLHAIRDAYLSPGLKEEKE